MRDDDREAFIPLTPDRVPPPLRRFTSAHLGVGDSTPPGRLLAAGGPVDLTRAPVVGEHLDGSVSQLVAALMSAIVENMGDLQVRVTPPGGKVIGAKLVRTATFGEQIILITEGGTDADK